MPSLLDMLRNPSKAPVNPLMAAMGIAPPPEAPNYTGVQAPIMPVAQAAPAAPPMSAPMPGADLQGADEVVTGDNWKPTHHRTLLGGIYDALVGGHHYQGEADKANFSDALVGLTRDPESVIRHLAKVEPEKAVALWNMYKDNERADGGNKRLLSMYDDKKDEYTRQRAISMITSGLRNPDDKWFPGMLGAAQKYVTDRGGDWTQMGLPTSYDRDGLESLARGEIPIPKRETIDTNNGKLDESKNHHIRMEDQAATNEQGRDARFNTGENGKNTRFDKRQTDLGDRQDKGIAAREALKLGLPANATEGQWIMGVKDKTMASRYKDGHWQVFKKTNGKMERIR